MSVDALSSTLIEEANINNHLIDTNNDIISANNDTILANNIAANNTISNNNDTISDNNDTISDNNDTISDNNDTLSDNNDTLSDNNDTISSNDDQFILRVFNRENLDTLGDMICNEIKPILIKLYYHNWKDYKMKTVKEIAAMLLLKENDYNQDIQISYYDRYLQLYENDSDMMDQITLKINNLSTLISKSQRGRPAKEAKFHYEFNKL